MREALIGLAGVLIGALATGAFEYVFRRRSERATLRASSRVLHDQLFVVWDTTFLYRDAIEPDTTRRDFSEIFDIWRETRGALAAGLTVKEWEAVTEALKLVAVFDGEIPGQIPSRKIAPRDISDDELQQGIIDLLHTRLEKATLALERIAFGRRHARRVAKSLERERREEESDPEPGSRAGAPFTLHR
jgi:hypothetical protein